MAYRTARIGILVAAFAAFVAVPHAFAAETPATFLAKVDHDADKTLSLPEVTTYALKRYAALDVDHDGTLTETELGDRISPEDFALADTKHGAGARTLSKVEFTTYVAKLFAAANERVKPGDTKVDSSLTEDELGTPAGLKLIKLLD